MIDSIESQGVSFCWCKRPLIICPPRSFSPCSGKVTILILSLHLTASIDPALTTFECWPFTAKQAHSQTLSDTSLQSFGERSPPQNTPFTVGNGKHPLLYAALLAAWARADPTQLRPVYPALALQYNITVLLNKLGSPLSPQLVTPFRPSV